MIGVVPVRTRALEKGHSDGEIRVRFIIFFIPKIYSLYLKQHDFYQPLAAQPFPLDILTEIHIGVHSGCSTLADVSSYYCEPAFPKSFRNMEGQK